MTHTNPPYFIIIVPSFFLGLGGGGGGQKLKAVQLYTDLYGAENPSTAIALHNLGLCYNANAEVAQGMDQLMIREQAKAAFEVQYFQSFLIFIF